MNRTPALYQWTTTVTNGPLHVYHHTTSSFFFGLKYSKNGTLDDEPDTDAPYDYSDYYTGNDDSSAFSCVYGDHGASILPVLYSLFFVVGFLGNILVIWVVLMGVKLRSMTDICLLNLALANLLLVSSLPFLAHHARDQWIFGDVMCTMVLSVYHIGFYMILKRLLTARSSRRQSMHLVTVLVVFFCCWVPYNITAFVKALELNELITQSCDSSKAINLSLQITEALAYSHSCLNPIFYVFVKEKLRRQLFKLLDRTPCSRLQFVKNYLTQATVPVYSHSTNDERTSTKV
ncbi:C-C chemokine receptor type 2 [Labeo rohita]|uniref:C-C chemokine receptor type 2 n=1 Tax=Labeo rohita TaxID=84645 RepID=A0ABQ8LZ78_LABRO|nr:C-C chemokine receptor type 2 [Labeo rohita]